MKVYISTIPFASQNPLPMELLDSISASVTINDLGRKITTSELAERIGDSDCLIAGTEIIDSTVFDKAPNLKLIARVGIGLDGVDLAEARRRGITVTYTPDAPAPAVAELTIGLMLQLARNIALSNEGIKANKWERILGYRLSEMTIGIIGSGRIGGRVIRRLSAFGSPRILVNSLQRDDSIAPNIKLEWVDKNYIYKNADLISFHVPLTEKTLDMVSKEELKLMRSSCMLVNTARGGIINEDDLYWALDKGIISQAAIDVFLEEPYKGPLKNLRNCHLTAHLGSMSYDCRARMEIEAVEEVVNFNSDRPYLNLVPEEEYNLSK